MNNELVLTFLDLLNETLAAAIVTIALSILLYNITRNLESRVARSSGAVLAAVTVTYVVDVFLSLEPDNSVMEAVLRLQWLGIAFIPAAIFHLSDALLATTGLPSRGRRRRIVRVMYAISGAFLLLAAFGELLVAPLTFNGTTVLRAGPLFVVYLAFFVVANAVAFINVNRARLRGLTRSTKRRMAYLQLALLTPAIGVFPYSMFLAPGDEFTLPALLLVNVANVVVILMLLFLAYPLSFFGSRNPDRLVKTELLRFMLRGPATGLLILVVLIFTRPTAEILGLPGDEFTPFALVGVVLFWQWMVDLSLPTLEARLIYPDEDSERLARLQQLSSRMLTHHDLVQLMSAIIEGTCDYLRVGSAFIASLVQDTPEVISCTGSQDIDETALAAQTGPLAALDREQALTQPLCWESFWLLPLYSKRTGAGTGSGVGVGQHNLIGVMGIEARGEVLSLDEDESAQLDKYRRRAARALDELMLQSEIDAALEGLLPQFVMARGRSLDVEYKPGHVAKPEPTLPDRAEVVEQVGAALRHYYGGPGMMKSRLLELTVVQQALAEHDQNAVRALRTVLDRAIENQRPEGSPDMRSQEWLLYNILQMRFIKKRRVRDTARSLYISEANLYRKQNLAIEAVADALLQMEQDAQSQPAAPA